MDTTGFRIPFCIRQERLHTGNSIDTFGERVKLYPEKGVR